MLLLPSRMLHSFFKRDKFRGPLCFIVAQTFTKFWRPWPPPQPSMWQQRRLQQKQASTLLQSITMSPSEESSVRSRLGRTRPTNGRTQHHRRCRAQKEDRSDNAPPTSKRHRNSRNSFYIQTLSSSSLYYHHSLRKMAQFAKPKVCKSHVGTLVERKKLRV